MTGVHVLITLLHDWPLILASLIILSFEAFFSGSEMALISADRLLLKRQASEGNHGAKLALQLLIHPERVLVTVLIGTTSCIALQGALITIYTHKRFGSNYHFYAVAILSPLVLIFGELIPKTLFQRYSNSLAPRVALPVSFSKTLFSPFIWILSKYTGWISKRLQPLEELVTGRHTPSHREELSYLLTHGRHETSIKKTERRMIHRILNFSRAEVRNALIPLVKVDAISDEATVETALEFFTSHGHSRLPVYHERIDNMVGTVHMFDLFNENNPQKPITSLMKPPYYVPETQKINDLLVTMQKQGIQMAVVVDEYGGTIGLVTMEDLIEEIVGDIHDEYDSESALYKQISDNDYLIQAHMEIEQINEELKLQLPTGQYETLAGFLLLQFNRIPEESDELYYGNLKFIITKASNRLIKQVRVTTLN